ncbi:MAG: ScyD/ScyE family protein [Acidimicrobiales bacterium]
MKSALGRVLFTGALTTAVLAAGGGVAAGDEVVETLIPGLEGSRAIDIGRNGWVFLADSQGRLFEHNGRLGGELRQVNQLPVGGFLGGPSSISFTRQGNGWILYSQEGGPDDTVAYDLYKLNPGHGPVFVADIADYQVTDPDPFDLEDNPTESNPFDVEMLDDRSALVADAAGNDILRVFPDGTIQTVACFAPTLAPTDHLPPEFGFPPGTEIPSERVPTSVAVGPDGWWYVGTLAGFPAAPGTSEVWRIDPSSVGAGCDPAGPPNPFGDPYAEDLTSIVDIAFGNGGALFVVELHEDGWLLGESDPDPTGSGRLWRIDPRGRTELAHGHLAIPGGIAIGRSSIYAINWFLVPGANEVLRITP